MYLSNQSNQPKPGKLSDAQQIAEFLAVEPKLRSLNSLRFIHYILDKRVSYIHHLKGRLSNDQILQFVNCLQLERFEPLVTIFHQGDTGRKMYFVLEGEVAILIRSGEASHEDHSRHKKQLIRNFDDLLKYRFSDLRLVAVKSQFDYFGEIALEQLIPRTATVITRVSTTLASLTYEDYKRFLEKIKGEDIKQRNFIRTLYPFVELKENQFQSVLHNAELVNFGANSFVYRAGQLVDAVYVVVEGDVLLQKCEQEQTARDSLQLVHKYSSMMMLSVGSIVGDYELALQARGQACGNRLTQAITKSSSILLKISVPAFQDMANNQLNAQLYQQGVEKKYAMRAENSAVKRKNDLPGLSKTQNIKDQYMRTFKRTSYKLKLLDQLMDRNEKPEDNIFQDELKKEFNQPKNQQRLKYLTAQTLNLPIQQDSFLNQLTVRQITEKIKRDVYVNKMIYKYIDDSFIDSAEFIQPAKKVYVTSHRNPHFSKTTRRQKTELGSTNLR